MKDIMDNINKMEQLLGRLEELQGGAQPKDIVGELEAKLERERAEFDRTWELNNSFWRNEVSEAAKQIVDLRDKLAVAVDALKSIESLGKSSDVASIASEALEEIE